jgi:hypothetical protein
MLGFLASRGTGHMSFFHEPGNRFCPTFDMKFIENIREVVLNRFIAQAKLDGDLLIGFSFSQKRQD